MLTRLDHVGHHPPNNFRPRSQASWPTVFKIGRDPMNRVNVALVAVLVVLGQEQLREVLSVESRLTVRDFDPIAGLR